MRSRPLPAETVTAVIMVQGILGFGWEWDKPLARLRRVPHLSYQAYEWSYGESLGWLARDLATVVNTAMAEAPPGLRKVVVIGHSVGGIIAAWAAGAIRVPAGVSVEIVSVAAPYAGLHATPVWGGEGTWAPLIISVGGVLGHYPRPAAGVSVESWMTFPPGDPVMKHRFGHDPGDPSVGPPGPRYALSPKTDHNDVLDVVLASVLARLR